MQGLLYNRVVLQVLTVFNLSEMIYLESKSRTCRLVDFNRAMKMF